MGSNFQSLRDEEKQGILAASSLETFRPVTKEVYLYVAQKCDEGKHDFGIPALLVPAMLGMSYKARGDMTHFESRHLEKHGKLGRDWIVMKKTDLFSPISIFSKVAKNGAIEFRVPGRPNERIIFRKNAGNAAKFYFVTPHFARTLIFESRTSIRREIGNFYSTVHDEIRKYFNGRPSAFDSISSVSNSDESSLKRNREEMELQRLQLAFDQQKADWQQAQFNTVLENIRLMKETFGMDERDRIYYKGVTQTHLSRSLVSSSSTALITAGENGPMLLENDGRGREISIPMVAAELGYRIRDKSSRIGKKMAEKWRAKHPGEEPPKHEASANGTRIKQIRTTNATVK